MQNLNMSLDVRRSLSTRNELTGQSYIEEIFCTIEHSLMVHASVSKLNIHFALMYTTDQFFFGFTNQ